jgi:hypothetical protein
LAALSEAIGIPQVESWEWKGKNLEKLTSLWSQVLGYFTGKIIYVPSTYSPDFKISS